MASVEPRLKQQQTDERLALTGVKLDNYIPETQVPGEPFI
jgi:hypothetical protein